MAKVKEDPKRYTLEPRIVGVEVKVMVAEYNPSGKLVSQFQFPGQASFIFEVEVPTVFKDTWVAGILKQVKDMREEEAKASARITGK